MEYFDLIDEHRRPLGRTLPRGAELGPGEYHTVAAVWTVNRAGRILLTLRDSHKPYFPGLWENTGGAVLAGETSREAAVRELFEETGVRVREEELILINSTKEEHYFADTYLVRAEEPEGGLTLQPGETVDAKWVTPDELDRIIVAGAFVPPAVSQLAPVREKLDAFANKKAPCAANNTGGQNSSNH